jgi:hypothetical protein
MSRSPASVVAIVLACVIAGFVFSHQVRTAHGSGDGRLTTDNGDTVHVTPEIRARGLTFAPDVSPGDRQWILAAIGKARPEAKRLIGEVDGMVTITTVGTYPAMGLTQSSSRGFKVWFNIGALDGYRSMDRDVTVLHELGHVVDFALVPASLDAKLDAGIPRTGPCEVVGGIPYGSCAATPERIADTFAKWALNGAVSAVGAGYAIATPASLEDWGAPLARLSYALPH